ncbi:repressor LexA [Candidatus Giovannonibacteria bacterium RIFCSPHIGHO2_02_42_15]|uniref:Repressor LexA n=2 Tax=Candidatus Giovannoniibacteriota TaxID=1752738 RepID=A0A1F5VNK2_9BACT|nr:MAG: LexA repressor [Candidatus Giovannonibacteria bacterium GW2011_GWF2_42_19]OGF64982.1 MAG: repressor LexA [Candidatus Giovannonibacteria bacterium RIFCSPHIGHO2_02_42_15]HBB49842.1 repressor LexA [Candidatus Nomurabacteria bacterium]
MQKKSNLGIGSPSKRQAEVLQFIGEFRKKKGYPPSLGEIAGHFDISIPTVHQHISYLRQKNLLTTERGKRRSIQALNNHKHGVVEIPLMGLIAAGGPIEAIRDPRPIEVPRNMLSSGANYYALKVAGTSMIEDGIFDGDIVVVHEQPAVEEGEKAVAYLPDKDAVTLKRIYHEKGKIKLVSANQKMKPFYEDNVEIQGKVVGVLRKEI